MLNGKPFTHLIKEDHSSLASTPLLDFQIPRLRLSISGLTPLLAGVKTDLQNIPGKNSIAHWPTIVLAFSLTYFENIQANFILPIL